MKKGHTLIRDTFLAGNAGLFSYDLAEPLLKFLNSCAGNEPKENRVIWSLTVCSCTNICYRQKRIFTDNNYQ